MIEKKAEYISEKLVEKNLVKNKDKDVYQYGIEVLISTAINIMLLLVIAKLINVIIPIKLHTINQFETQKI